MELLVGIILGAAVMMSGAADAGMEANRAFLMLNDHSIEFIDGVPALRRCEHRWDAKEQRSIQVVDGVEFLLDKQFWKMIDENDAAKSARKDVRVGKDGRLFYHDKPVELGLGVGRLDSVLRWQGWIVAVGTAADKTRSTIKGPIWYLFWFGENSLKGSYREVDTTSAPPLRIYSK
jgi:hypothetical protein